MNILEEIKNDHDMARGQILQVENKEYQALEQFRQLAVTILAHHAAEEHVVFPELTGADKEMRLHLIAEHDAIRRCIQTVLDTPADDENWKARFHVVRDLFNHHIEGEEERLFEALRSEMAPETLEAIYEPFEKYEQDMMPEMEECVNSGVVLTDKDLTPLASKFAGTKSKRGSAKTR